VTIRTLNHRPPARLGRPDPQVNEHLRNRDEDENTEQHLGDRLHRALDQHHMDDGSDNGDRSQ